MYNMSKIHIAIGSVGVPCYSVGVQDIGSRGRLVLMVSECFEEVGVFILGWVIDVDIKLGITCCLRLPLEFRLRLEMDVWFALNLDRLGCGLVVQAFVLSSKGGCSRGVLFEINEECKYMIDI